jgi:hypothetical protein
LYRKLTTNAELIALRLLRYNIMALTNMGQERSIRNSEEYFAAKKYS